MTLQNEKNNGFITLKEASERYGYSADYIGQLIRKGKIPGKQVYSHVAWVTTPEAIEEYLKKERRTETDIEDGEEIVPPPPLGDSPGEEGGEGRIETAPSDGSASVTRGAVSMRILFVLLRILLVLLIAFAIFLMGILFDALFDKGLSPLYAPDTEVTKKDHVFRLSMLIEAP